jgi:hypothetical protein
MRHTIETTYYSNILARVCYVPESQSRTYMPTLEGPRAGIPPDDYKYLDGTGSELTSSY